MTHPTGPDAYDLRSFFQALGGVSGRRPGLADEDRTDSVAEVEVFDEGRVPVRATPLAVRGYVDGVQASACVAYFEHRPVQLMYVGAACIGPSLAPVAVRERLSIVAAECDADRLDAIRQGIPLELLGAEDPMVLERVVRTHVDSTRERLELEVIEAARALPGPRLPVVVDGDLRARGAIAGLVGVAKTLRTRYLADETVLLGLPPGWRSPRFRISAGGGSADRFSCYLRILDAGEQAWSFGLIRLEAYDPELLDPLAALCLSQRQGARSGDRRFDVHLAPVRACEELLRARRPAAFRHL